jgi:hypothetical protein
LLALARWRTGIDVCDDINNKMKPKLLTWSLLQPAEEEAKLMLQNTRDNMEGGCLRSRVSFSLLLLLLF